MTGTAFPFAQLTAELVRHPGPAAVLPPPMPPSALIDDNALEPVASPRWREDLRFFLVCYATAFLIFMLLLG